MEIKAILTKPYQQKERFDFIVEQNHNKGYEIKESETALEAWGYTEEELSNLKKEALNNTSITAMEFINLLQGFKVSLEDINAYIDSNIELKTKLTYQQKITLSDIRSLCTINLNGTKITDKKMTNAFENFIKDKESK